MTNTSVTHEEYQSLKETYKLLYMLIDPQKTPRIPKYIRQAAKKCLKHYPIEKSMTEILKSIEFFNPR